MAHRHRRRGLMHHHRKRKITTTIFYDPNATTFPAIEPTSVKHTAPKPSPTARVTTHDATSQATLKTTQEATHRPSTTRTNSTPTSTKASSTRAQSSVKKSGHKEDAISTASASVSDLLSASSTTASTHGSGTSASASLPPSTSTTAAKSGLAPGAAAGVAIGVIGAFVLLGGILFLLYRKKVQQKQEAYGNLADEKSTASQRDAPPATPNSPAPPSIPLPPTPPAAVTRLAPPVAPPVSSAIASPVVVEFNDEKPLPSLVIVENTPHVPLSAIPQFMPDTTNNEPSQGAVNPDANLAAGGAKAGSPIDATASQPSQMKHSIVRKEPPAALVLNSSPVTTPVLRKASPDESPLPNPVIPAAQASPTPSSFTDSSITSGASGSAAASGVYRVQMDFAPSMGDELELRAGQLIRILHEYDDGWALCVRLDRSQQGVCPRTCLSQRPVRPRPGPRGPPRPGYAPNGRPGSPSTGRQSPHGFPPSGGRASPAPGGRSSPLPTNGRHSPGPRVVAANTGRQSPSPMSTGGYQRPVYQSPSRPQSPVAGTPTTPTITISLSDDEAPRSPSPVNPRPAVPLARPSPLSKEATSSDTEGKSHKKETFGSAH